jgi:hypothetical protein
MPRLVCFAQTELSLQCEDSEPAGDDSGDP